MNYFLGWQYNNYLMNYIIYNKIRRILSKSQWKANFSLLNHRTINHFLH